MSIAQLALVAGRGEWARHLEGYDAAAFMVLGGGAFMTLSVLVWRGHRYHDLPRTENAAAIGAGLLIGLGSVLAGIGEFLRTLLHQDETSDVRWYFVAAGSALVVLGCVYALVCRKGLLPDWLLPPPLRSSADDAAHHPTDDPSRPSETDNE